MATNSGPPPSQTTPIGTKHCLHLHDLRRAFNLQQSAFKSGLPRWAVRQPSNMMYSSQTHLSYVEHSIALLQSKQKVPIVFHLSKHKDKEHLAKAYIGCAMARLASAVFCRLGLDPWTQSEDSLPRLFFSKDPPMDPTMPTSSLLRPGVPRICQCFDWFLSKPTRSQSFARRLLALHCHLGAVARSCSKLERCFEPPDHYDRLKLLLTDLELSPS